MNRDRLRANRDLPGQPLERRCPSCRRWGAIGRAALLAVTEGFCLVCRGRLERCDGSLTGPCVTCPCCDDHYRIRPDGAVAFLVHDPRA